MPRCCPDITKTGIVLIISAIALIACAQSQPYRLSVVGPDGTLKILGPRNAFDRTLSDGTWLKIGQLGAGQLAITNDTGVRALLIRGTPQEFAIVRPLDAILLTTPFLEWSWNVSIRNGKQQHQTSVLVGFHAPDDAQKLRLPDFSEQLPDEIATDRVIALRWGASALQRGDLHLPGPVSDIPVYIARGGKENANRWWRDGVDLSGLYTRIWPDDDMTRIRVSFIAIVAETEVPRTDMLLADIDLSR